MAIDFGELQRQVGAWAEDNFADQPPTYPLIGAGEEAGENTMSVLKRLQGIADSDKYSDRDVGDEAEQDAVGDIVIYLADYFSRHQYASMKDTVVPDGSVEYDTVDEIILDMYVAYGRLCREERHGDKTGIEAAASELMGVLSDFCDHRGYDFENCITEAWDEVSDREWDSNIQHSE